MNYPTELYPGCPCFTCDEQRRSTDPSWFQRMYLCPNCGNKRCPGAADHTNVCSGSNAVGQVGSLYA